MGPELGSDMQASVPMRRLPLTSSSCEPPTRRRGRSGRANGPCVGEQTLSAEKGKRRAEPRHGIRGNPTVRAQQPDSLVDSCMRASSPTNCAGSQEQERAPSPQRPLRSNRCHLKMGLNGFGQPPSALNHSPLQSISIQSSERKPTNPEDVGDASSSRATSTRKSGKGEAVTGSVTRSESTTASSSDGTSESDAPTASSTCHRQPQRAAAAVAVARLSSTCSGDGHSSDEEVHEEETAGHSTRLGHPGSDSEESSSGRAPPHAFPGSSRGERRCGRACGRTGGLSGTEPSPCCYPQEEASLEDIWTSLGPEYFQDPLVVQDLLLCLLAESRGNIPSFFQTQPSRIAPAERAGGAASSGPASRGRDGAWWGEEHELAARSQTCGDGEAARGKDHPSEAATAAVDCNSSLQGAAGKPEESERRGDRKLASLVNGSVLGWERPGSSIAGAGNPVQDGVATRYCWQSVRRPGDTGAAGSCDFVGVRVPRTGGQVRLSSVEILPASGAGNAPAGGVAAGHDAASGSSGSITVEDEARAVVGDVDGDGDHHDSGSESTAAAHPAPSSGDTLESGGRDAGCISSEPDSQPLAERSVVAVSIPSKPRRASTASIGTKCGQTAASSASLGAPVMVRRSSRLMEDPGGVQGQPLAVSVPSVGITSSRAGSDGLDAVAPSDVSASRASRASRRSSRGAGAIGSVSSDATMSERPLPNKSSTRRSVAEGQDVAGLVLPSTVVAARKRHQKAAVSSHFSLDPAMRSSTQEPRCGPPSPAESPRSARRRTRSLGKEAAEAAAEADEPTSEVEAEIPKTTVTSFDQAEEPPEAVETEVSQAPVSTLSASLAANASDRTLSQGRLEKASAPADVPTATADGAPKGPRNGNGGKDQSMTERECGPGVSQGSSRERDRDRDHRGTDAASFAPQRSAPCAVRMQGFPRQICRDEKVDEVSARLAAMSESLYLMEQIVILPALRRVASVVQTEVDRRSEEHAKNVAATRIERAWRVAGKMPSPPRRLGGRRPRSASCSLPFLPHAEGEDPYAPQHSKRRRASEGFIRTGHARATRRRPDDEEWSPSSGHARGATSRAPQAKRRRTQEEASSHPHRSAGRLQPPMISDSSSASSDVECGSVDDSPLHLPPPLYSGSSASTPAAVTGESKTPPAAGKATRARRSSSPWRSCGGADGMGRATKRVNFSRRPRLVPSRSPLGGRDPGGRSQNGKVLLHHQGLPTRADLSRRGVVAAENGASRGGVGRQRVKRSPGAFSRRDKGFEESESYSSSSWGSNGNSSSPERESRRAGSRSRRRYGERWQAEDGSKRHSCREWDCPRRAHFGTPGWVPAHCEEHRRDWEVFLKYASCLAEGCGERPAYSVPGDRSRVYCRRHRVPGSVTLASAGWKIPEGSRFVGGAGGWVEAEEDGMGVPVDSEAEEDEEGTEVAREAKNMASAADVKAKASPVKPVKSAKPVLVKLTKPVSVKSTKPVSVKSTKPVSVKSTKPVSVKSAKPVKSVEAAKAAEVPRSATTEEGSGVNAGGKVAKKREAAGVSSGVVNQEDGKGSRIMETCLARCEAKPVVGQKALHPKPSGIRMMSSGLVVLEKNRLRAEQKRARVAMMQSESEGKTEEEDEDETGSSGPDDAADEDEDDEFGEEEEEAEEDEESASEGGDGADEHVFAPGRFAFLVPSKKCSRPILVGKIVTPATAATASPASTASRSSSAPAPVIPVSSATALLLAQAAALGATPASGPAPAPLAVESSSLPMNEDGKRWIHLHWHTPASLRRGDYCRGPFTPDFVKKEWSKSGGWAPFVTKIRKSSVVVTCPGLLASRCIPADVLKELGV